MALEKILWDFGVVCLNTPINRQRIPYPKQNRKINHQLVYC
jgi:hypothetical protein